MLRKSVVLALAIAASACGGSTPGDTAKPRVFFVEPQDGATVKSPVALKFGIENFELSPVPPGDLSSSRPNLGHHHVGVDQDCLPAGTAIVKGTPNWIHFGKAETNMTMQLTPGRHKLTLQLGDDLHRTIEGLCQTITVNVTE